MNAESDKLIEMIPISSNNNGLVVEELAFHVHPLMNVASEIVDIAENITLNFTIFTDAQALAAYTDLLRKAQFAKSWIKSIIHKHKSSENMFREFLMHFRSNASNTFDESFVHDLFVGCAHQFDFLIVNLSKQLTDVVSIRKIHSFF
ncbi:unnamed protein product [Oikopleura dioica]|uniref:Uncharacterized protein n=1 Tax=Oikopleura dioica TaxID=34765 RepID=E4Y217_OIKDI|nr:unnamed protein product [Oikopleura dioica]